MLKIKQCFLKEKNTEIKKENQDHIMYLGTCLRQQFTCRCPKNLVFTKKRLFFLSFFYYHYLNDIIIRKKGLS